jgi:transglutaminase-like putative cysteine protease
MNKNQEIRKAIRHDSAARPERVPYHPVYFLMVAVGITAALWQHGHPFYTLTLLALVIPCSLAAYVPYRYFPLFARRVMMSLITCSALAWGVLRLTQRVTPDKIMIECICLFILVFAFSPRAKNYGYMLLVSVLLLLYGALMPRSVYLLLIPVAFVLTMFMIYGSRINGLAGDPDLKVRVFKYNWGKILLHLLMVCGFWLYFYALMPAEEMKGEGLFVTSFRNLYSSYFPPDVNEWFKNTQRRKGRNGPTTPGKNPVTAGKQGPKVPAKSKNGMQSSGKGAGPPGKDMVFRVKAPVKLYWLAQIYDYYDGDTWFATDKMTRQKHNHKNIPTRPLKLEFIMEKWLSPVLYSAFRAEYYDLGSIMSTQVESNFYHSRFKDNQHFPAAPFAYGVNSIVYSEQVLRNRKNNWTEQLNKKHYLQLPGNISARVKKLAKDITENIKDPYEKAIALRNHLREKYAYKQESKAPPTGREAVDFFLFDLKEGHCEYYASALAVLARLNGLPTRVATGFSPGNYNALSKLFEVHEYHAHAWTQIFFEEYGWLTMDGTPPGYIVSRTTPFGMGVLGDPFGNEWKVRPPELAIRTQELATPDPSQKTDGNDELFADKLLYDVVMLPETIGKLADSLISKLNIKKLENFSFGNAFRQLRKTLENVYRSLRNRLLNMLDWFKANIILGILCAFAVAMLMAIIPLIARALHRRYERYRCKKWLKNAREFHEKAPDKAIRNCYMATRKMLEINGFPRINNMDLIDYAAQLQRTHNELGSDALAVFFLYNQLEYSSFPATPAKAGTALKRSLHIAEVINESKAA